MNKMNLIKIQLALLCCAVFMLVVLGKVNIVSSSIFFEEKVYCDVDINEMFDDSTVLVVMKKNASEINKKHDESVFGDIHVKNIYDLTHISNENTKEMSINLKEFRQILEIELETHSKEKVIEAIHKIEKLEDVLWVGPNGFEYMSKQPPSATVPAVGVHRYPLLWGLNSDVGINAEEAWDFTTGNADIKVGVIDSGMDDHVDINANKSAQGGDFVNMYDLNNNIPGQLREDPTGHGTHVSGTIGATGINPNGITGAVWNIELIPLQVSIYENNEWVFSVSAIVRAITWAIENGIDILNYSGGGPYEYLCIKAAINNFSGLFVTAAGNTENNNDVYSFYPSDYSRGQTFSERVISVGAYTKIPNNSSFLVAPSAFSNYGENTVSIFAPGTEILSIRHSSICDYSEIILYDGTRLCETTESFILFLIDYKETYNLTWTDIENMSTIFGHEPSFYKTTEHESSNNHYLNMNGTSMATPHVTGVAAMLWNLLVQSNNNFTKQQIAAIIKTSILSSAITNDTGTPFYNKCVTDGRLDAYGAVKYVLSNYYVQDYTLNSGPNNINIEKTVLQNNDYFNNDNGFYKLNVNYTHEYSFNVTSNNDILIKLYDLNFNELQYTTSNITNGIRATIQLTPGTYFFRVSFLNNNNYGTIHINICDESHVHSYPSTYIWYSLAQHRKTCCCGSYIAKAHVVGENGVHPGVGLPECIVCHGPASVWIGKGYIKVLTHNGSYITENGVIVLVKEDLNAFVSSEQNDDC